MMFSDIRALLVIDSVYVFSNSISSYRKGAREILILVIKKLHHRLISLTLQRDFSVRTLLIFSVLRRPAKSFMTELRHI